MSVNVPSERAFVKEEKKDKNYETKDASLFGYANMESAPIHSLSDDSTLIFITLLMVRFSYIIIMWSVLFLNDCNCSFLLY